MNPNDENQPRFWIDPALEARVVAHVLGETSAFEAAELDRLLAENPELALFSRRITAIHDLVATAAHSDAEPLRLAPDRRAELLAVIGTVPAEANEKIRALSPRRRNWPFPRILAPLAPLAACLIVAAIAIPLLTTTKDQVIQEPADFEGGEGGFVDNSINDKSINEDLDFATANVPTASQTPPSPSEPPAAQPSELGVGFADSSIAISANAIDQLMAEPGSTSLTSNNRRVEPEFEGTIHYGSPISGVTVDDLGRAVTPGKSRTVIVDTPQSASAPSDARVDRGATSPAPAAQAAKDADQSWKADLMTGWDSLYMVRGVDVSLRENKSNEGLESEVDEIDQEQAKLISSMTAGWSLPKEGFAEAKSLIVANETTTATDPISTFSLHVGDVSFQLAADSLAGGETPDPARIRPEEFTNAFDYNDPAPGTGESVAGFVEQSAHPFLQQRNLVRIAVRVAAAGRATGQPLRLTFLLDTSGSMERADRAATVRQALETLAPQLGPDDRVNLIGFSRTPRLLAEDVPGDQAAKLADIAARTPAQGGTNLESALDLASEIANKQFLPAAQNRIILLTDGAANLGDADPDRLAADVTQTRQRGISFDAAGVGAKGLNDTILEALTRQGDGRYYFLNTPDDAEANFARQLAGALRPAAENVKVQVVFNPDRVASYRLLGFDDHRLAAGDFRNDQVDAAELSAEEAGVALYQFEPLPEGRGEVGKVFVRFRDPSTNRMVERSWTIPYLPNAPAFDQAPPSLQLAGTATLLAEHLRGDARVDLDTLSPNLRQFYPNQTNVQTLTQMLEASKK